ncbi:MAG: carbamoyl-phosphate synthase small subunit [Dehalococcoidia bacterium]|nr:carbamoyl-phosphate synthase small subunit [Dehalococcoidia bacterium]
MSDRACLVLEDGSVWEGRALGARASAAGEVVFNTSMTGYQQILTDPSYGGQIVMPTYPLIGNYGINAEDAESRRIQVRAFIVREHCAEPSHYQSRETVHDYLAAQGIPGIADVDTRAITRKLRERGVMMGMVTSEHSPGEALELLKQAPPYQGTDYVREVSAKEPYEWTATARGPGAERHIVVLDMGVKYNILRILRAKGCRVTVVPAWTPAGDLLGRKPDGVLLSPGPGDPALLGYAIETVRGVLGRVPVLGICLGHQITAHALGGKTYKLKFGHRGGNHPVRDNATGLVHITAQNHGFTVDGDSLPRALEVSHVSLNDGTVEGMTHREIPLMTIQYHSEASPGPLDNVAIFDRFLDMVCGASKARV